MSNDALTTTRSVGRPKSFEKRCAILAAAANGFIDNGFDVSVDHIAKTAGVSKQTVYSHFDSKDDLFDAVIEGKMQQYFADADMQRNEDLATELTDRGHRILDLLSDPKVTRMMRAIASSAISRPDIGQRFWSAGPKHLCETIASTLRRHRYPCNDYEACAQRFVHALAGSIMMASIFGTPQTTLDREQEVESVVSLFCHHFD